MSRNHRKQVYRKDGKANNAAPRKSRGYGLEDSIFTACDTYRRDKVAVIDKVPEPGQIVKYIGNRKYLVRYADQPNNLFSGIMKDGRMVVFSYAQTDQQEIDFRCVREKIINRLDVLQKNGAVCFIIIGTPWGEYYRLPLWLWMNAKAIYKDKGVSKSELEIFQITKHGKELLFLKGV